MTDVQSYLARVGYEGSTSPTFETLRALHYAHLLTVPFENLDIALGLYPENRRTTARWILLRVEWRLRRATTGIGISSHPALGAGGSQRWRRESGVRSPHVTGRL